MYILVVLFGLAVGSFLNVIILRFDELKTIWTTRSHCPKCKKEIHWYDLVPFFSYFILQGKCRFCKKPISFQYPLVEGTTAVIFALILFKFGLSWEALLLAITSSLLIVIAVYDTINYEIPEMLVYLGIIFSLTFVFLTLFNSHTLTWANLIPYGYAVLASGGFFGALVIISKEKWMGQGDILLAVLMGVLLGLPNILVGLFLAFIFGSIYGLLLIAAKKKHLKDAVPFGPFLVLGTFVALLWGRWLVNWYLGIF